MDEGFCIIEMIFGEGQKPVDFRLIEINPAFARQSGLGDVQGKRMRELAPRHEQHWFDIYGKVALTGQSVRFENYAAAVGRWFDVYAFRINDSTRVGVIFNDVTARKQAQEALRKAEEDLREHAADLEKTVATRTRELQESNQQLEAFCYSIAHDLRSPLRAQQGFAGALIEDYGPLLGEKGLDYADRIVKAAKRLDTLVFTDQSHRHAASNNRFAEGCFGDFRGCDVSNSRSQRQTSY